MNPRGWIVAALALVSAGCVSVEESGPAEETPVAPPPVTVVKPAPVAKPSPPPSVVTAPPPAAPEVPRASEVESLIGEFARMRKLVPLELAREQEAARLSFNQSRSDSTRVRFAMALALPGAPGSDDARALDLLEPLVKTPGATLHSLAFLLSSYVQEQRRLAAQVAGLQQHLQGLQQNVQGLQQKLDAIKSLERSLSGRGEPGTVRRK
ncbi:MAG TPA: hypothetical protein VD867_14535 [Burkholderiales bacterium]|nr:hypothetical protein [Burkholderiales bacterium]